MLKGQIKEHAVKYHNIKKSQFNFSMHGGFFAFGDDQFQKNKIGEAPFVHLGAGLYCSKSSYKDLMNNLDMFSKNKNNYIKENVNPYGVFSYEADNHEASYSGDLEAPYKIVKEIYGEAVANEIMNKKDFIGFVLDYERYSDVVEFAIGDEWRTL